jgi:hypothetical protein
MSDRSEEGENGGTDLSEERIAELEERIEDLSEELRAPPEGPFGLPRPPTPGEVLAFVDDHAIPTTIAILEANVRALKALRGAIGLLRRTEERTPGGRTATGSGRTDGLRARTDSVAREAVGELDRAVSDLANAIEGDALPDNDEAESVLREIRAVRDDVADALASDGPTGGTARDPGASNDDTENDGDEDDGSEADGSEDDGSADDDDSGGGGVEIDVENELQSIKDEMHREDPYADGSGSSEDDSSDGGDDPGE